jgi:hypothetical protein
MVSAISMRGRPATFRGMSISETGKGGSESGTWTVAGEEASFLEE